jgi:hypothetical protein
MGCSSGKQVTEVKSQPVNVELFNTINHMDSIFWKAYNTCDMELQSEIYSENIEFFHDQMGLITSKKIILDATRNNICGKITRELVKGSVEVYPIPNFGAVQTGMHKFHNVQENWNSEELKFIVIWEQKQNSWKIAKVISLH